MKKTINLILLLLLFTLSFGQQKEKKINFSTEIAYIKGVLTTTQYPISLAREKGFSFNLSSGYTLNDNLTVGGGLGLDYYRVNNIYAAPVFLLVKSKIKKNNPNLFVFFNAGYSFKLTKKFHNGLTANSGIGYNFKISNKMYLSALIGYKIFHINNYISELNYNGSILRNLNLTIHSLKFSIGLNF